MYTDYYLKFDDEAGARAAMESAAAVAAMAVDHVGLVQDEPAVVDVHGDLVSAPVYAEGWHVNVRMVGELPSELETYVIPAPATPARVWA